MLRFQTMCQGRSSFHGSSWCARCNGCLAWWRGNAIHCGAHQWIATRSSHLNFLDEGKADEIPAIYIGSRFRLIANSTWEHHDGNDFEEWIWLCIEMSIRSVVSHCRSWRKSFSHVPLMILKAETCSASARHNSWATAILFCWLWTGRLSGWVRGKAQRPSNAMPGWEQSEWRLPCIAAVNPKSQRKCHRKIDPKTIKQPLRIYQSLTKNFYAHSTHTSNSSATLMSWQVQAKLLDDGSQGSPPSALLRLLQSEAERLVGDFDGQVLQGS